MCNKYVVQERLFCKEMWLSSEAVGINRRTPACSCGRAFAYNYARRRPHSGAGVEMDCHSAWYGVHTGQFIPAEAGTVRKTGLRYSYQIGTDQQGKPGYKELAPTSQGLRMGRGSMGGKEAEKRLL